MTSKLPVIDYRAEPRRPMWSRWLVGPRIYYCLCGAIFLVMLGWTKSGWNDPIVDFGRELYVPWQITQGKVLYRDIAYFNGPLSPYFNALVFTFLGVSLRSIVIANLVLLALLAWMIWKLFEATSDPVAATAATIVLLTVFSFIQLGGIGNYNFVTPYSHEITHGIILSVAAIFCVYRCAATRDTGVPPVLGIRGGQERSRSEGRSDRLKACATDNVTGGTGFEPVCATSEPRTSAASSAPITDGTPVSQPSNSGSGPSPQPSPGVPGEGVARCWLVVAGFLLGLVFLTKVEIFVAAAPALIVGVLLAQRSVLNVLVVAAAATIAPIAAFLLLWITLPSAEAFRGVLGSWWYVFDGRITSLVFYQRVMGTDDVGQSVRQILASTMCVAAVLGSAIAAAFTLPRNRSSLITAWMLGIGLGVVALLGVDLGVWQQALRWLTIGSALIAAWMVFRCASDRTPQQILRTTLAIFAVLLLAKIFLNVRSYHYGFALAMPATLVALAAGISWLPPIIERRGGNPQVLRIFCICIALLLSAVHLRVFSLLYATKDITVGADGDQFEASPRPPLGQRADRRALDLLPVLSTLDRLPPGKTLATVPEGTMINYLSRRVNPTPYITLMPPEVLMFGEDRIVHAFQEHPPDYIVMLDQSDASEYGFRGFGIDYGVEIAKWINANYSGVPLSPEPNFPIRLLRRIGN